MSLEGLQFGHYRLIRQIGSGGMGEIYVAEDIRIARQVAVKVVRTEAASYPDPATAQENTRLFRREMRAIASLDSPHIMTLLDFGEETIHRTPVMYMVMPFRQEGSLHDWLSQRSEKLSLEEINSLIQQAADALQHAHDQGVIHQDVKPSNFLIRDKKEKPHRPDLLLADFGIAKLSTATSTASQNVRGTSAYMPPEQWDGQPTPATDQYALAIMTYQLLTGRPPFMGRMEQVMRQHFTVQPQAPSKLNTQVSPALDAVILRALEKKPEDRFPSVSNFATAFQQALHYHDLRATITLSQTEALRGLTRNIMLPGKRQVTVTVPPNAQSGQVIHLEGQGQNYYEGGSRGPLLLTVAFAQTQDLLPPEQQAQQRPLDTREPTAISLASSGQLASTVPPSSSGRLSSTLSASPSNQPLVAPAGGSQQRLQPTNSKSRSHKSVSLLIGLILVTSSIIGFVVYQNHVDLVNQINAANPYPSYLPGYGTLALYDPLTQPDQWSNSSSSDGTGSCQFSNNALHVRETNIPSYFSCYTASTFSNFAFEVQMQIINGDCGGMTFHMDVTTKQYYYFRVCQDQSYAFNRTNNDSSGSYSTLLSSSSSVITAGLNQVNTIAIVANGSDLEFYVNDQKIDSMNDDTYSQGEVGVVAEAVSNATEVVYSNARVWTL